MCRPCWRIRVSARRCRKNSCAEFQTCREWPRSSSAAGPHCRYVTAGQVAQYWVLAFNSVKTKRGGGDRSRMECKITLKTKNKRKSKYTCTGTGCWNTQHTQHMHWRCKKASLEPSRGQLVPCVPVHPC